MKDPDGIRQQVVTVLKQQFFIKWQQEGPARDHLVSRRTATFKAKPVNPDRWQETGWDWCFKSSWVQAQRRHEGEFLKDTQGPGVINLLVYDTAMIEDSNDSTVFGRRQCSSGDPMDIINAFGRQARRQNAEFVQHTGTQQSSEIQHAGQERLEGMLLDPRRPMADSQQTCDNRERRNLVVAWANSSFDEATSPCDLQTHLLLWQQAFAAVKYIADKGICHRDISFRNVRVESLNHVRVCDFDMAMVQNSEASGANDRTGTVAFMATSILGPERRKYRPVYDCESVFWLCTLELLCRIGVGQTRENLANMMGPGRSISVIRSSKQSIVQSLTRVNVKKKAVWLESYYNLAAPKDWSLLCCLAELAKEFHNQQYEIDYEGAEEFESTCFNRCIEIINQYVEH
ncbi:hypothetical protein DV735_g2565, partial [Chaetothyriales sp. CBS 134920]